MKFDTKHKRILTIISVAAIYVSVLLFTPMLIKIPGAISYTAATNRQLTEKDENQSTPNPVYSRFKEIEEPGPYRIGTQSNGVYVFSGSKCLYRIKTTLSQFSEQDAESVLAGLEITDKPALFELIEYIES